MKWQTKDINIPHIWQLVIAGVLGIGMGMLIMMPFNVSPTQYPEEGLPGTNDSGTPTATRVPTELESLEIPVVMGDRVAIKTEFPVKDSTILLNVTQQISASNFKVNLADTHHVIPMPQYEAYVFVPAGEPDVENVQGILPASVDLLTALPDIFTDVTDISLENSKLTFKSGELIFSGFVTTAATDDGTEWQLFSIVNSDSSGDLEKNWLDAMKESLGPYYSREFTRPQAIENDIVDRLMRLDIQGLALPAPRTGVDTVEEYPGYTVWSYSNVELFGGAEFIATACTGDVYGSLEALDLVAKDIETAFMELHDTEHSAYIITDRQIASWSNLDAYYSEGEINGRRIVSYMFYNPAINNYSTISCISVTSDAAVNCEKLLNAISERITFFKGV